MGEQRSVLPFGRSALVQPVFRTVDRQRFPHLFRSPHHIVVLYLNGSQRRIQQRLGNYSQRVEGLQLENHQRVGDRPGRSGIRRIRGAVA